MELVFVRHGEPDWGGAGADRTSAPLTDRGRTQADHIAQRIFDEFTPLSEIKASTALRAQETAQPIPDLVNLPIDSFDGLGELGLPRRDVLNRTKVRYTVYK